MKKLINWSELSALISDSNSRQTVRENNIPKKYKPQVDKLIEGIEQWEKFRFDKPFEHYEKLIVSQLEIIQELNQTAQGRQRASKLYQYLHYTPNEIEVFFPNFDLTLYAQIIITDDGIDYVKAEIIDQEGNKLETRSSRIGLLFLVCFYDNIKQ